MLRALKQPKAAESGTVRSGSGVIFFNMRIRASSSPIITRLNQLPIDNWQLR